MNNDCVNQTAPGREAMRIISALHNADFVAYLAGGCVRDCLLGQAAKDFDIATDAVPDEVRRLFGRRQTLAIGAAFGVIAVLPPRTNPPPQTDLPPHAGDEPQTLAPTEVATFRSDGTYSDGRRPDTVRFGDAEADAQRRDFTVNGLFFDPQDGEPSSGEVVDHVGGINDLRLRRIRTIGSAQRRFDEDQLRMLRAVRFATTKSFTIDDETLSQIQHSADRIANVSAERVGQEIRRTLTHSDLLSGLRWLKTSGLADHVWPSLNQSTIDAAGTIDTEPQRNFVTSLAYCLQTDPNWRRSLTDLTSRWRLSNQERDRVTFAVGNLGNLRDIRHLAWHKVQPVLVHRHVDDILQLAQLTIDDSTMTLVREKLALSPEKLNPAMLIDGNDLRKAGVPCGPRYRDILQSVRDQQLDGQLTNREDALREIDQWT